MLIENFRHVGAANDLGTANASVVRDAALVEIVLDNIDLDALLPQPRDIVVGIGRMFDRYVADGHGWAFLLHHVIHGVATNQNRKIRSRILQCAADPQDRVILFF